MKKSIFKAYDVRGLFPQEIDAPAGNAVGRALARHLSVESIVIGTDMRESGGELRDAMIEGLSSEGVEVIDIGRVATPMVYFATAAFGATGGVMITASHNPAGYNGFKLCGPAAIPIGIESGLAEIRDLAFQLLDESPGTAQASVCKESVHDRYAESLRELFPVSRPLKVAIDAGNGIAGEAYADLLDSLPLEQTRLYFEPDGSFPNHEANPLEPENLEDLQKAVREQGADMGIAFDGDGDRAVFVDETGEAIPADLMTAALACAVVEQGWLDHQQGGGIVYDLRSSRIVPETIEACGAIPIRSRVGHAFMKQVLRETGACFGGELSGHYYFSFPSGYVADDAAATMLLLMKTLELRDCRLSELWTPYRKYSQSGELNRRVKDVAAATTRVREAFPDGEADQLDGLTVQYEDWWFNLRPSNTEPLLRLNLEAPSEEEVKLRCEQLLPVIEG